MSVAVVVALVVAAASPLESRSVVVVPAVVDDAGRASADAVAAALQARGLVPVANDAKAGVDGVVVDVGHGDRERARGWLQEARARFRDLEFDVAEERAAAAFAEALRLERPEDQRDLVVDILLFQAAVRLSIDRDDADAVGALRLASRLEPSRTELDPGLHRPSVVAAFAAAREQNLAARTALVVVAPRVVGVDARAEVVVDGVGRVPDGGLLLLAEGPHLLSLRAPGVAGQSRVLNVKNGATEAVDDILAPADIAARRNDAAARVRAGDDAAFAVLARLVDADVVVALASGGRPRALAGAGVRDVKGDPDDVTEFAGAVFAALDEVVVVPPKIVEPEVDLAPWIIAGGISVVVGGVAGLVYYAFPEPDSAELDPSPTIPRPVIIGCCAL